MHRDIFRGLNAQLPALPRLRLYLTEYYRFVFACVRRIFLIARVCDSGRRDVQKKVDDAGEEEDEEETEHAKMQEERAMTKRSSDPIWARARRHWDG